MANQDANIAQAFIKGEPVKHSWVKRVKRGGMWGGGASTHSLYASDGTARLSVVGDRLVSYERWDVAIRLTDGTIILNGDTGPTMTTKGHQREARDACKALNAAHAFLPFSALRAARIHNIADIKIMATTADKTFKVTHRGRDRVTGEPYEWEGEDHFLGEVLFTYNGRYYVSGLDRNDAPRRRKFYLARLPEKRKPMTVDAALDALRPRGVPGDALRQGEWFLIPSDKRPKAKDVIKSYVRRWDMSTAAGVPIVSDKPSEMQQALNNFQLSGRHDRHRASRMYLNGAVYVSGLLRDNEHGPLKLGDGKTWYRVVRNAADGSWGANGDVD